MGELFTLTEKKEIRLSSDQKIIKGSDFSLLLDSAAVLEKAKSEAIIYRKEVAKECEAIKQQAELEGFDRGLARFNEQISFLEKALITQKEKMKLSIASLASAAVKRIIGKELSTNPQTILDIIATSLKPVSQHKRITISVNREDFELVEKNRPKLKALFENIESLSIEVSDEVERGGCYIKTEAGIINAQLENQLRALEDAFQKIVEKQYE